MAAASMPEPERPPRADVHLVVGGDFHDMDYARLRLLSLLAEHERVRTSVASDYASLPDRFDALVTYTCNVRPSEVDQVAVADWVADGGRWFALHGTNSALDLGRPVRSPRAFPLFATVLGSQFVAHPPIAPYLVSVTDPDHPLCAGIEPFEVTDELYLSERYDPGDQHVLLHTTFSGEATGFEESSWPDDELRPVAYLRAWGHGEVLYLTLGHCRGHYDMQPHVDWYPTVERGSWELPVFDELLRRGLRWAIEEVA